MSDTIEASKKVENSAGDSSKEVGANMSSPPTEPAKTASAAATAPTVETTSTTVEKDAVTEVGDQFDKITIFGNKSLKELEEIQAKTSHLNAGILFDDPKLNIPEPIVQSLVQEMRFKKPSAIQAATLPVIFSGKNLVAQAQSGAGKTIAFTIGMLRCVDTTKDTLQALCLSPTRELANQIVSDALVPLSTRMPAGLKFECAVPRESKVTGPCTSQIVVGTCGTVISWINAKRIDMSTVKMFVLDEADKMIEKKEKSAEPLFIHGKLKKNPKLQVLLFSATYNDSILKFAKTIAPNAEVIRPPNPDELVLDVILQVRMDVSVVPGGKLQVLKDIYDFMTVQQSIVFVETIADCNKVAKMMKEGGFEVSVLHSDLKGEMRDEVFGAFRDGTSKVLIATNALARGVDVPAVAVVVNYDLPATHFGGKVKAEEATYLHRIGRCGRFGRRGTAINLLATPQDYQILETIERYYSPEKPMTIEWDARDLEGLAEHVRNRGKGGEILPLAQQQGGV